MAAQPGKRFVVPPGWPPTPQGWTPPPGWEPDPSWPPAPDGWQFWRDDAPTVPAPATPPAPPASSGGAAPTQTGPLAAPHPAGPKPGVPKDAAGRRWVVPAAVGAGALVFGIIVGAAAGSGGDVSAEPPAQTVTAPGPTVTVTADPSAELQATLNEQKLELDDRAAALDDREAALDDREKDIDGAEKEAAANTFEPGTYLVGDDIKPGKYKGTAVGDLCYLAQNDGNDIMWNNVVETGQWVATVEKRAGSTFEFTADCGPAKRVK